MIKLRELSKFVQDAKPGDHFFFFCKIYLLLNFDHCVYTHDDVDAGHSGVWTDGGETVKCAQSIPYVSTALLSNNICL